MATATDSDLKSFADKTLDEASLLIGPEPETPAVSGDDWRDIADRAAKLLKRAWNLPRDLGAKVGGKIRDAARAGVDKASSATQDVKDALAKIAASAATLAAGAALLANPIIIGLIIFAVIEHSGWGKRARRAGRRYVSQRARAYGF